MRNVTGVIIMKDSLDRAKAYVIYIYFSRFRFTIRF